MKVLSSKPISIEEVNDMLTERKKEGELDYIQEQTLDYTEKFVEKSKNKKAEKIIKELTEKKVPANTALKIIEVWPKNEDTLKLILSKEHVELSEEDFKSLLETLSK